jgi:hypothetical protein
VIPPTVRDTLTFTYSTIDFEEANDYALWYSRALTAPESLITESLYRFKYLRFIYADSTFPFDSTGDFLHQKFQPSWWPALVEARFDDSTSEKIRTGTYPGWGLLDSLVRPTFLSLSAIPSIWYVQFSRRCNPMRVAEMYTALPGNIYCIARNCYYDEPTPIPIRVGRSNGEWTFLFSIFRPGRGNEFLYYFKYRNNRPVYIGWYDQESAEVPEWFPEAKANNIDIYCTWDQKVSVQPIPSESLLPANPRQHLTEGPF